MPTATGLRYGRPVDACTSGLESSNQSLNRTSLRTADRRATAYEEWAGGGFYIAQLLLSSRGPFLRSSGMASPNETGVKTILALSVNSTVGC